MKNTKKLWIALSIVGVVVIALVAGIAVVLGNDSVKLKLGKWYVEETFTKTIHDFPDHMIDNLDEQEDTNFVVYAKNVKRIITENDVNIIIQVDEANKVYTIENPDEQIASLEEGDVFFMDPSESYATGIAVKVDTVEIQEAQAVITGRDISLGDVIEYADVDMMMPTDKVFVAKQEDSPGAAITWVDSSLPLKDSVEGNVDLPMTEIEWEESVQGSAGNLGQNGETEEEGNPFYEFLFPTVEMDVPYSLDLSTGFNLDWGNINVNGNVGVRLDNIHVVFQYSRIGGVANMGVTAVAAGYVNSEVKGEIRRSLELMGIPPIPIYTIGPITLTYEPKPCIEAAVSVGGSVESYTQGNVSYHVIMTYVPTMAIPYDCGYESWDKQVDYSFGTLEGTLDANVAKGRLTLGALNLAGLYGEINGGLGLQGTLENVDWEAQTGTDKPSIHECEWCVDGKAYRFARLSIGYDLNLWDKDDNSKKNPQETTANAKWNWEKGEIPAYDVMHWSWNIVDIKLEMFKPWNEFYVSKQEDQEVDFGLGECPHRLWRTDVLVMTEGNESVVPEAMVRAYFPDGRDETNFANEGGELRFYLPNGTNTLEGEADGLKGKETVEIKDEPVEVELFLKGSGDMHILWSDEEMDSVIDDADTNSWSELENTLVSLYPEAEWHYGGVTVEELCEVGVVKPGDIVLDITYDAPHRTYGIWRDDNLADGDNSNVWGEAGGWIYTGCYRICKDQNSGNVQSNLTYGLSISYNPSRKAYLANPALSLEAYEIRAAQNTDPFYNDEYLLISYGPQEEGQETWREESIYLQTHYVYDVDVIRSIPSERRYFPQLIEQYLPIFTNAMLEQLDLEQRMIDWTN